MGITSRVGRAVLRAKAADPICRAFRGHADERADALLRNHRSMSQDRDLAQYRAVIDELVDECRAGQGQVLPRRVREGVWNPNNIPETVTANELVAVLDSAQRQVLAGMLESAYVAGVHGSLRVLHDHEVRPFDDGREGTPFNDFMGRLGTDWEWPGES